jgi:pentatricopeptide repeat protein
MLQPLMQERNFAFKIAVKSTQIHAALLWQCGRSLLDMYAKCGSIEGAWRVFNKMTPSQNAVTWNAMMLPSVEGTGNISTNATGGCVLPSSVLFVGGSQSMWQCSWP